MINYKKLNHFINMIDQIDKFKAEIGEDKFDRQIAVARRLLNKLPFNKYHEAGTKRLGQRTHLTPMEIMKFENENHISKFMEN